MFWYKRKNEKTKKLDHLNQCFSPWHPKRPMTPLFSRFVTGNLLVSRALFRKLSRVIYYCHGHKKKGSFYYCDFLKFWRTLFVTGTFFWKMSRAVYWSHGHFFEKCHGHIEKCHGKKKHWFHPRGFSRGSTTLSPDGMCFCTPDEVQLVSLFNYYCHWWNWGFNFDLEICQQIKIHLP